MCGLWLERFFLMPSLPRSNDSEPRKTDTELHPVWAEHAPVGVHTLLLPGDEVAPHTFQWASLRWLLACADKASLCSFPGMFSWGHAGQSVVLSTALKVLRHAFVGIRLADPCEVVGYSHSCIPDTVKWAWSWSRPFILSSQFLTGLRYWPISTDWWVS